MIRKYIMGAFALVLALSVAGSVFAESSFTTTFDGARVRDESRKWDDRDLDALGTIIEFRYCSHNTEVQLWRERLFFDELLGSDSFLCKDAIYSNDFGRQLAGTYYFEIADIFDSDKLDVETIFVQY